MRGCGDLLVNKAHLREFENADFPFAQTVKDGEAMVGRPPERRALCYCDKVGSLFALRAEFCMLEQAWAKLTQGEPEWRGIGFLKIKVFDDRRTYRVYSIHSRFLRNQTGHEDDRWMICWVIPIVGMELVVREIRERKGKPPKELECMVDWYGKTWLAPRTHRLKPDHGYTGFDRLLLNATERLKDGERVVTAQREAIGRLAELKGDIDYEPIEEYLLHLFKRHHGANGQGKHLREEIAMVRQRLFDPLAVIPEVQDEVSERLRDVFRSACNELSSWVEWPLVRGNLSPQQLEFAELEKNKGDRYMKRHAHTTGFWRARLDSYREQKAIRFPNFTQFRKADLAICEDDDLSAMPLSVAPEWTIVVPAEAVPLLKKKAKHKRLRFKVLDVVVNGRR